MTLRNIGRRGQNTVEYLMMVSVVVGVVLVGGSMLKRFMPSLFGNVQEMIAGAATGDSAGGDAGADGGTSGGSSGHHSASPMKSGDDSEVAAAGPEGADGGTHGQDAPGHGHAHGAPHPHSP